MYHSDDDKASPFGYDCLYVYVEERSMEANFAYIQQYHLIPHCRRPNQTNKQEKLSSPIYANIRNNISFKEMFEKGITSIELLNWTATIDIAERYEKNGSNSNEIFYNCSLPWFGSMCQYKFEDYIPFSMEKNIYQIFVDNHFIFKGAVNIGCYSFLITCYRGPSPSCLDWREICNGKFDCLNGEDEEFCEVLELNECSTNEYRCHYGGQCIPSVFVNDGKRSIDCLDGSDEGSVDDSEISPSEPCWHTLTFRCEEFAGRQDLLTFSCGDGEYRNHLIHSFYYSCGTNRDKRMSLALINSFNITTYNCQQIFSCLLGNNYPYGAILSTSHDCQSILDQYSSGYLVDYCSHDRIIVPEYPVLFGLFQFVYLTNRSIIDLKNDITPDFICFYANRCPALVSYSVDIGILNGLHCSRTNNLIHEKLTTFENSTSIFEDLILRCLTIGQDKNCSHSSLFHCPTSLKCISKYRLVDGRNDCYYGEDERFLACELNDTWRYNCEWKSKKCLSMIAIRNGKEDCENGEDEWNDNERNIRNEEVSFGFICDNKNDWPSMGDIDETDCKWWPCNNPNTRCDGGFDCLNGIDELNCLESECSLNEIECRWIMLPIAVKCISILNLTETCLQSNDLINTRYVYPDYKIQNNSTKYFLWNSTKCITPEHILSCQSSSMNSDNDFCSIDYKRRFATTIIKGQTMHENKLISCKFELWRSSHNRLTRYLKTSRLGYSPSISSTAIPVVPTYSINNDQSMVIKGRITKDFCYSGIAIWFRSTNTQTCLCPPNYFGDQCQWQNQRISLTLQFIYRTDTYVISVFQVMIMLTDDRQQITSYYEQILYIPKYDCSTKFNIYLLYPNRPKIRSINYSIRIDMYDKIQLKYWSTWYLSIPYQFLPVNRISTQLFIPLKSQTEEYVCSLSCGIHGHCMKYINQNQSYYCQCDKGYSGKQCDIKENCSCSLDSYCLTSSICICPLNKFGKQCYLKQTICNKLNNPCLNNGSCISKDDRIYLNQYRCLCKEGFYGERCEYSKAQIDIEFSNKIIDMITPAIFVHLISSFEDAQHEQTTIFKKIIYNQNQVRISTTQLFNLVFIELFNKNYYLSIIREKFFQSELIQIELQSNQQCIFIQDILNETFQTYSYYHRIKYYPLLCRENDKLKCFYDEHYMCVCDLDRFSNCFLFNFNRTYNCQDYFTCENDGQCFQDNITCPSRSICVCSDCYYGTRCQFSTKGLILSLDYILAYHIKPNLSLFSQPLIIKISMFIIIIMFLFGLINGYLSISTFQKEKLNETGSGFYLLISSWISIFIIFILLFKFWQLILSQMSIITNRTFLLVNCILLDVMMNILAVISDWLDACVSIERVIELIKGNNFNKQKYKQAAKWVASSIFIITILTHLPDALYSELIDDINDDEQRTWCLSKEASPSIDLFNRFMTFFHFFTPLSINLISIIIIIVLISRFHSRTDSRLSFRQHLTVQTKQHRHHLITLCGLVLLALPRLVISFLSGCMKSPNYSALFLTGYLMSFLPAISTSIIFILPWKIYKREFTGVIYDTIRRIRRISHL